MSEFSIPVDLFNPGQVFACLGFLEAAETLVGACSATFDWRDPAGARFLLNAETDKNPFSEVLSFIEVASVQSIAPHGSRLRTEKPWGVPTRVLDADAAFPYPEPDAPATLPAQIGSLSQIDISYWGDTDSRAGRDPVKFWGGAGGYPGAALVRDAIGLVKQRAIGATADPFALSTPQSSSFRLDWRRDYIPIDAGFSLNSHCGRIAAVGYPLVELLATIGLSNARPERIAGTALRYRYGVIGCSGNDPVYFAPLLLRAALGAPVLPFPQRTFQMQLGWPAKKGQARAITQVSEEVPT